MKRLPVGLLGMACLIVPPTWAGAPGQPGPAPPRPGSANPSFPRRVSATCVPESRRPKPARCREEIEVAIAWQIALERAGFSPGIIDGRLGPKTALALREFQRVRGLPTSGTPDAAAELLNVTPDKAVVQYTVRADDSSEIDPPPKDWVAKSQRKRLGFESLEAALAEKFHCSRALLRELNPGRGINELTAGDTLWVPAVDPAAPAPRGTFIEIDVGQKVVRVMNQHNQLIGLFHCSIAADKAKVPTGRTQVDVVSENPTYRFDPKMWPEVKDVRRPLLIPAGPSNPVGRCWIGLRLPGYGIHGTPNPELIGKTGSHGCFRLTNWDAVRLSKMISVGAQVHFVNHGPTG